MSIPDPREISDVKIVMLKGEKGDKGDKGDGRYWGEIEGDIEDQADLQIALDAKYEKPVGGIPTSDLAERENVAIIPYLEAKVNGRAFNPELNVDYPSAIYGKDRVPSIVARYAQVNLIKGKTRAWNQLVSTTSFPPTTNHGVTFSIIDGILSVSGTSDAGVYNGLGTIDIVANHKYLVIGKYLGLYKGSLSFYVGNNFAGIYSATENISSVSYQFMMSSGVTTNYTTPIGVYDLTLIFGSRNEPSTVAEALAQIPSLGQYNAYDAGSLVDTEVSGVESVGVNIWDEEWENGYYTASGKQASASYIRSKNYIKGFRSIFFNSPVNLDVYGYSSDSVEAGTLIGNGIKNTNVDASLYAFIRFSTAVSGTSSYANNIQLCDNSLTDSIKTVYHPYKTDTLSLSETVTLRSAGSVSDELDVESGVVTRKVGSIVLDGSVDEVYGSYSSSYDGFPIDINGMSIDATNPSTQLVSDVFIANTVRGGSGTGLLLKTWGSTGDRYAIFLCGTGETTVAGLRTWLASHVTTINYNLNTTTTEQITPIDPFLEVEGNGTITPHQTQSPEIDSAIQVGYLIV